MKFLKVFLNVFSIIICVALCFAIFGIEIATYTVYSTSKFISAENIKKIVTNVDFEDYVESFKESNPNFEEELKNVAEESGIDYETLTYIINSESVKEVVGDYISSSVDAILNDGDVKKPTVDQLMNIIEENEELIEKIAEKEGVTLTPEEKEELLSAVRESLPEVIDQIPDIKKELNGEEEGLLSIRMISRIVSTATVFALIVAVLVIYLLISLFRWSFHKSMLWTGIPTLLSSIVAIGLSLSIGLIKPLLNKIGESFGALGDIILNSLSKYFLIGGIIGLVIAIGLIAGFILINKKKNKDSLENSEV